MVDRWMDGWMDGEVDEVTQPSTRQGCSGG